MLNDRLPFWGTPFSQEYQLVQVSHLLIGSDYEGLAYRACDWGKIVNPSLAGVETKRRCRLCEKTRR